MAANSTFCWEDFPAVVAAEERRRAEAEAAAEASVGAASVGALVDMHSHEELTVAYWVDRYTREAEAMPGTARMVTQYEALLDAVKAELAAEEEALAAGAATTDKEGGGGHTEASSGALATSALHTSTSNGDGGSNMNNLPFRYSVLRPSIAQLLAQYGQPPTTDDAAAVGGPTGTTAAIMGGSASPCRGQGGVISTLLSGVAGQRHADPSVHHHHHNHHSLHHHHGPNATGTPLRPASTAGGATNASRSTPKSAPLTIGGPTAAGAAIGGPPIAHGRVASRGNWHLRSGSSTPRPGNTNPNSIGATGPNASAANGPHPFTAAGSTASHYGAGGGPFAAAPSATANGGRSAGPSAAAPQPSGAAGPLRHSAKPLASDFGAGSFGGGRARSAGRATRRSTSQRSETSCTDLCTSFSQNPFGLAVARSASNAGGASAAGGGALAADPLADIKATQRSSWRPATEAPGFVALDGLGCLALGAYARNPFDADGAEEGAGSALRSHHRARGDGVVGMVGGRGGGEDDLLDDDGSEADDSMLFEDEEGDSRGPFEADDGGAEETEEASPRVDSARLNSARQAAAGPDPVAAYLDEQARHIDASVMAQHVARIAEEKALRAFCRETVSYTNLSPLPGTSFGGRTPIHLPPNPPPNLRAVAEGD